MQGHFESFLLSAWCNVTLAGNMSLYRKKNIKLYHGSPNYLQQIYPLLAEITFRMYKNIIPKSLNTKLTLKQQPRTGGSWWSGARIPRDMITAPCASCILETMGQSPPTEWCLWGRNQNFSRGAGCCSSYFNYSVSAFMLPNYRISPKPGPSCNVQRTFYTSRRFEWCP